MEDRYCVIGAGAAGLAVARNFQKAGIDYDVYDRHDDVGGLWGYGRSYSAVYRSARLISSRPMTEFREFPMQSDLPDYPGQQAVFEYLRAYADHFNLRQRIRFGVEVTRVEWVGDCWEVETACGLLQRYRGMVLASGFTWDPSFPEIAEEFGGHGIHSVDYKEPETFAGKRVLVVGGGNSGCDIAAELGPHAQRTCLSVRRGYHFIPRYVFGIPSDQFGEFSIRMGTPMWIRQRLNQIIVRILLGNPADLGFPEPDHRVFESHPVVNSEVLAEIRAGNVMAKPDVRAFDGTTAMFADGTSEEFDCVIFATGYKLSFPYLKNMDLNGPSGKPELYLHMFHPRRNDLFVCGMIQPDSGVWGLMDEQARLIAAYINAVGNHPAAAARFDRQKSGPQPDLGGGVQYLDSDRHHTEVEHSSYRTRLYKQIELLS